MRGPSPAAHVTAGDEPPGDEMFTSSRRVETSCTGEIMMDLKRITSLLKRIGLGVVVAGSTVFATSGCDITKVLQDLVKGVLPGASA